MHLSKSTRILILLAIDSSFFLLELTVGYAVHSLALVADSFHMLNDVLSLCVGLWAVKVAHDKPSSNSFTYGWQRAETLGALVNGVFLVALCLSIFLDAIQRFVEPQNVSNPKLVLIVGCFGLASNILGLFLFHDHGHGHGDHGDHIHAVEEGRSHTPEILDEDGPLVAILPETVVTAAAAHVGPDKLSKSPDERAQAARTESNDSARNSKFARKPHWRHSSGSRRRFASAEDINIHPASFRNDIIAAGRLEEVDSPEASEVDEAPVANGGATVNETSPLLDGPDKPRGRDQEPRHDSWHVGHKHTKPREAGHGGHSHGDLNMRGVFLHVVGDALGNFGVIGSALIIWLTPYWWRLYADPAISLVITIIILASAIPLCMAASRILLQGVPAGVSVDDIKADIQQLPGIISCHHVHVWQLSDTKLVASLHVEVGFDFKGQGSARYMQLARAIRRCLHAHGIHSSTIQPEFCLDASRDPTANGDQHGPPDGADRSNRSSKPTSRAGSPRAPEQEACLLECDDECGDNQQCCGPSGAAGVENGSLHGHGHAQAS